MEKVEAERRRFFLPSETSCSSPLIAIGSFDSSFTSTAATAAATGGREEDGEGRDAIETFSCDDFGERLKLCGGCVVVDDDVGCFVPPDVLI